MRNRDITEERKRNSSKTTITMSVIYVTQWFVLNVSLFFVVSLALPFSLSLSVSISPPFSLSLSLPLSFAISRSSYYSLCCFGIIAVCIFIIWLRFAVFIVSSKVNHKNEQLKLLFWFDRNARRTFACLLNYECYAFQIWTLHIVNLANWAI